MTDEEIDWRERYDRLAAEVWEIYGIVHSQLTDPARTLDAEQRIAVAANEIHGAAKRLEAREIFDREGL